MVEMSACEDVVLDCSGVDMVVEFVVVLGIVEAEVILTGIFVVDGDVVADMFFVLASVKNVLRDAVIVGKIVVDVVVVGTFLDDDEVRGLIVVLVFAEIIFSLPVVVIGINVLLACLVSMAIRDIVVNMFVVEFAVLTVVVEFVNI